MLGGFPMQNNDIRLSSTEITGLWVTYLNDSASSVFLKYFLQHTKDQEIIPIVKEALDVSHKHLELIKKIFMEENFPIPEGFSEKDLDLSSPPLFYDIFSLSFVYGMTRIALLNYGGMTSNVVRDDILDFFSSALVSTKDLYNKSVRLMISKGIYDRPPKVPYPKKVEFIEKQSFLAGWFGERRPLNTIEITELFFNIERNYFGVLLAQGFIQVIKDKEINDYVKRGKELAEKQINIFNNLLMEENLLGTVPVSMEVTDSTISPFSEKLIMFFISILNASSMNYIGHALSTSLRRDLATHHLRLLSELMQFAEDGINIMINRGWMEKPPHAPDREKLNPNQ